MYYIIKAIINSIACDVIYQILFSFRDISVNKIQQIEDFAFANNTYLSSL